MNRHKSDSKRFNSTSGRNITDYSNYLSNSRKGELENSNRTLLSTKEDIARDLEREIAHLNQLQQENSNQRVSLSKIG